MLQNAYFLAKIGADTAENEQHLPKFAKNWQLLQAPGVPARRSAVAAGQGRDVVRLRGSSRTVRGLTTEHENNIEMSFFK